MATDKLVDFDHVTDYISREAAIKTINELLASPYAKNSAELFSCGVSDALRLVRDILLGKCPESWRIPAADVVEVVRCKDCNHFIPNSKIDSICSGFCKKANWSKSWNDFCSDGERRPV